ncbi:bacterio-opsin activator HTH domain-containing protein [Halococcus morrhuae DSM 1307]|uniref:Bacterio-opsin activator HTH domain-containing protein n=1 Tax=Halococcus morrhuae DSM 1307 TaxID=931277 RepID=M0M4L9_HALMO|nr:helix-turn-helix domain-containing protein [Halococcus morrhuae]EMA40762.1 bacterio-opsin activator HTH domain-containing protein [Halococcus morrhuae DSM 1307]
MSLIAIVHIAHEDLALSPTIRECPDVGIRVMSQSVTDPDTGLFFFYVENGGQAFEAAIERDHTVVEWMQVNDADSGTVYRLEHTPETLLLSPKTIELGGLMRDATSDGTGWTVRLQFEDREALSQLWEYCQEAGITFELQRLFRDQSWVDAELTALTDPQLDALVTAYEEGYFEEPRTSSLEELANRLDISPTAVGGRIRRGTAALIETTLAEE